MKNKFYNNDYTLELNKQYNMNNNKIEMSIKNEKVNKE